MKLSVIIPIYKVEKYLQQCVDSVLGQTYEDLEVILVDDGSPDACPQICDRYSRIDKRVSVIHKENGGLSDARNAGLLAATGEYVIFLDSDDYYASDDFLSSVMEATDDGVKDAVFYQRTVFFDNSKKVCSGARPYRLEWNNLTVDNLLFELAAHDELDASACMKATKRSFLLANDLFFKKGLYCEDIEWFSRYMQIVGSVAIIDKPDYYYRKRDGSITASLTEKNIRDLFYSIQTYSNAIRCSALNDKRKRAILSYHSYQYYIVLGLIHNIVMGDARCQLFDECKAYSWLSTYSISRKTKRCAFVFRLLGQGFASMILGRYIKYKK